MKLLKVLCILFCLMITLTVASCRKEDHIMENYPGLTDNKHIIKELSLEELTNEFKGVDKAFALQAGRELRIIVKPEEITDAEAYMLARNIKNKIETTMNYPGTIKVTVIRETRAQEVAR